MMRSSRITSFIERHDFILIVQMREGIEITMQASRHFNYGHSRRLKGNLKIENTELRLG
jgi:hypothetical protein